MTSNISKKIFENIWFYLIFIPFLIPLGPENYIAWYKDFYTGWMEISTILMALSLLILCMGGFLKIDKAILFLLLYHIVFLLITIVEQHTITNGFQKLLSTPILILYINEKSKNNFSNIVNIIGNILLCDFVLNILVFNEYFFRGVYDISNHNIFLGHVQTISILGVLGVYIGYDLIRAKKHILKGKLLILFSLSNMLYSQASTAYVAVALCIVVYLLSKSVNVRASIVKHIKLIVLCVFAISIFLLFLAYRLQNTGFYVEYNQLFNSRPVIWNLGLLAFFKKIFLGYGAYGIQMKPYWLSWQPDAVGFNYAHNTVLQLLLDGGVVLLICFYAMISSCVDNIRYIQTNARFWIYSFLTILLVIGFAESITDRVYFFIFLTIMISEKYNKYSESENEIEIKKTIE